MKRQEYTAARLRRLAWRRYLSVTAQAILLAALLPTNRRILEMLSSYNIDVSSGLASYYSRCEHLKSLIAELSEISDDAEDNSETNLYLRT